MSYNILGINPFHNGSACVLSDGEVVYFLEEERLSKNKHDANPFRVILDILKEFEIDEVVIAGINHNNRYLGYTNECPFSSLIKKFYPKLPIHNISDYHHLTHISQAFYNSGFTKSLGIVIDAAGSSKILSKTKELEQTSVYKLDSKSKPIKYCSYPTYCPPQQTEGLGIAPTYQFFTTFLGFKMNEDGKLMGLSSYGKPNNNIPPLLKGFRSDTSILFKFNCTKHPYVLNSDIIPPLKSINGKNIQYLKDLAWRVQNDTQEAVGDLIEENIKKTSLKQVCCSGGYFLNCVANYYLTKRFPDIKFYFEPISHDGGTAIGAAYYRWKELNSNFTPKKQKTLYYGPKYSKEELLEGIKKYT